jgi:hypothetical protein
MKRIVLLSILSLILVSIIFFLFKDFSITHSKTSCVFASAFAILLVALWAVPILGIGIESKLISVKNSVSQVEQQSKILTKQSEALLKAFYVLYHGSTCYGGSTEFHKDQLSRIFQELLPVSKNIDLEQYEKTFSQSYNAWLSNRNKSEV